ncbi:MAG: hypothetical protein LBL94_04000 [Prevotellaceae bacterium]|jgi:hypothetical protein|nr:hypothetical protein [Prevotellaceae bacterium]
MKTNNVLIYAAAATLLTFAACSNDVEESNANGELISEVAVHLSSAA